MVKPVITVRRATIDDVDGLALLFDSYRQFYGQNHNPKAARAFLLDRLEAGESVVFLAEDAAHSVAGFTQLFAAFSSVSLAQTYVLNDLFVSPEFRRRGVGRSLLSAAVAFCQQAGAVRISLSTGVANSAAHALYEAAGWTQQTEYHVYTLTP